MQCICTNSPYITNTMTNNNKLIQLPIMKTPSPLSLADKSKHHDYTFLSKVGSGNFGQAYLVKSNLNHSQYIIKKIRLQNRNKQSKQQILKQIKLMQQLNHCYIIKYRQSFVKDKEVCIVMEYAENGDLQRYLEKRKAQNRPLGEEQVIQWFTQIALGVKYIHEKKIVHRDLKPDNIFITSFNQLKIGDFGISKLMNETFDMAKTKIGTPFIMAPQIWQNMKYNQKSDIWSLGCVLHKMMTFKYPFQAENSSALMIKILTQKVPQIGGNYSAELKGLVMEMMELEAQNRPSVQKILEKPFIKKHLSHILHQTINLHDQNMINSGKPLKKSTTSNNLFNQKRSLSSLSHSALTPKNSNNIQQYLKIIEYKQNYPMILQENKHLKLQLERIKLEKGQLEHRSQNMIIKWRQSHIDKQDMLGQIEQMVLNYLYP